MSIEIPNKLNSAGVFADPNGYTPTPNAPTPIFSSAGIEPYNPAQGTGNIVGGLTRVSAGSYVVRQVDAIDPLEGVATVVPLQGSSQGANALIIPGLPLNPTPGLADAKGVGVDIYDLSSGTANDGGFQLLVWRFATGPRYSDLS